MTPKVQELLRDALKKRDEIEKEIEQLSSHVLPSEEAFVEKCNEGEETFCPCCGTKQISMGYLEENENLVLLPCECTKCKQKFTLHYSLNGYVLND
jgi:uridine kinase